MIVSRTAFWTDPAAKDEFCGSESSLCQGRRTTSSSPVDLGYLAQASSLSARHGRQPISAKSWKALSLAQILAAHDNGHNWIFAPWKVMNQSFLLASKSGCPIARSKCHHVVDGSASGNPCEGPRSTETILSCDWSYCWSVQVRPRNLITANRRTHMQEPAAVTLSPHFSHRQLLLDRRCRAGFSLRNVL